MDVKIADNKKDMRRGVVRRLSVFLFVIFSWTLSAQAAFLFGRKLINQEYAADSPAQTTSPRASGAETYVPPSSYNLPSSGICSVSSDCGSSARVKVDVTAKCMCIGSSDCFRVDIGYNGPGMTTNGIGVISADVSGGRYQTKSSTSTDYDKDALRMGIGANDRYGKWIHKTRECKSGGLNRTAGCIAVPCAHWPEIKAQAGQSLQICRGSGSASSVDIPKRHRIRKSGGR